MNCSIIIPVGPGHENLHREAIASVNIASTHKGPFEKVDIVCVDDTKGEYGRSKARNIGVKQATGEWLFFLDADDLMHPQAFDFFGKAKGSPGKVVLHEISALFGQICEYHDGLILSRFQIPRIESYAELLSYDPYMTLQMGHFVRREVALEIPFNENMNCGEDWDYYLRLWKHHRCAKGEWHFMANRRGMHSEGPKSATGKEWTETVRMLIEEAVLEEQAKEAREK